MTEEEYKQLMDDEDAEPVAIQPSYVRTEQDKLLDTKPVEIFIPVHLYAKPTNVRYLEHFVAVGRMGDRTVFDEYPWLREYGQERKVSGMTQWLREIRSRWLTKKGAWLSHQGLSELVKWHPNQWVRNWYPYLGWLFRQGNVPDLWTDEITADAYWNLKGGLKHTESLNKVRKPWDNDYQPPAE